MALQVNRFQVVNIGREDNFTVGIKDHLVDKIIVIVKYYDDKELNELLAEELIIALEEFIQREEEPQEETLEPIDEP